MKGKIVEKKRSFIDNVCETTKKMGKGDWPHGLVNWDIFSIRGKTELVLGNCNNVYFIKFNYTDYYYVLSGLKSCVGSNLHKIMINWNSTALWQKLYKRISC